MALGRAIVRTPKMFLMDEPLGHLEAYLRVQLRAEVRRLHERLGATTVHITHDQEEAAAVSDRIAVMNDGRLQQLGTLLDLLDRPANRFVAEFIGIPPINVLPATLARDGGFALRSAVHHRCRPPSWRGCEPAQAGEWLTVGIRPEDVSIAPAADDVGALDGRVAVLEPQGDRTVIIAETTAAASARWCPPTASRPDGATMRLRFAADRTHLFAADGANLLHGIGRSD